MTRNQFVFACNEASVDPAIALENEDIIAALRAGDADEVRRLLREDF